MNQKNRRIRTVIVIPLLLIMCLGLFLTGCGFSAGNSTSSESYDDIFTDAVANRDGSYKSSQLAYKFSLDGFGEMMVYVDTSNGHSFELQAENGGFNILDKDGNVVIYAAALNQDAYKQLTAELTSLKTINNRPFILSNNLDGSVDVFTYLADVGLDCGFVMENKSGDADAFSLVAFRGEPLEGSSTDPYTYKGVADDVSVEVTDDVSEDSTDDIDISEDSTDDISENSMIEGAELDKNLTTNTLDSKIAADLNSLDTDYNKIYWGAVYSLSPDTPYFIISVTPYTEYNNNYLVVGFTNLYNEDLQFSASLSALDSDGNEIGETYVYQPAIGTANTCISVIDCGESIPDGRIHYSDVELTADEYSSYVPWELDFKVSGKPSDGTLTLDYAFVPEEDITSADIDFLYLDKNGYVLSISHGYVSEEVSANSTYEDTSDVYSDDTTLSAVEGVATFSNPTKDK